MQQILQAALEHHHAGRLDEADAMYREILHAEPGNANAMYLLGVIARDRGMNDLAVEWIERAHRHQRPRPPSLKCLAEAYLALGRPADARKCFGKALALKPDDAETHFGLGAALSAMGKHADALTSLRRAVALDPGSARAHFCLGEALEKVGRRDEAVRCYLRSSELRPDLADVQVALGGVLQDLGRADESEACYRKAIAIDPDLPSGHAALAGLLKQRGRLEEAETCFRDALARAPGDAQSHFSLGNVLYDLGRIDEARQLYRAALELAPDMAEARWAQAIAALPLLEAGPRAGETSSPALEEIRNLAEWFDARRPEHGFRAVGALQPFYLAYVEQDHRNVLAGYGELCSRLMRQWYDLQHFRSGKARAREKIRVGIVSSQVHVHSVWDAIVRGWVRHLDRDRFDLNIFHLGAIRDVETEVAKSLADGFDEGPKSLRQWVEAIAARRCDALIYPEVGMDAATLRLAALRLAPIQLAAWGHPLTTGLPTIDHYLSAELFEPERAEAHYCERLAALPNLGVCYEPREIEIVEPDLAALGIRSGCPLLICPGAPFKYLPRHDGLLVEIARGLGRCQMVFFALKPRSLAHAMELRLRNAFSAAELDFSEHCVFVPRQAPAVFHGLMKRADVYLDTIGFSGFNTAMQAVRCGLPVVTRAGRFMRGNFAAGILRRIGLPDLIASSSEDYVALAVRLAHDADWSRDIRRRIEASRDVLYGDLAPVRALEQLIARELASA